MAQIWHTPEIWTIEDQIRWEMEATERGVTRAREQMDKQTVGEGDVGLRLLRRVLPPFIERIKVATAEAQEGITAETRGRPQLWWWMIQMLEPDVIAVIALKSLLALTPREFTFNRPVTGAANTISNNILILVVSATSSKAKEFVSQVKGILTSMPMVMWLLEAMTNAEETFRSVLSAKTIPVVFPPDLNPAGVPAFIAGLKFAYALAEGTLQSGAKIAAQRGLDDPDESASMVGALAAMAATKRAYRGAMETVLSVIDRSSYDPEALRDLGGFKIF